MMKYLTPLLFFIPTLALSNNEINPLNTEFSRFQQQTKNQSEQIQQSQQQRWINQRQYQSTENTESQTDLSQVCLPYKALKFEGVTLIDPSTFAPRPNECLNEIRLNKLSQDLTAAYLAAGYIYNPFQFEDDNSGILTMRVTEGSVGKLSSKSKRLHFANLLPRIYGKPLNVRELDQALDQANKMAGSKVTVDVLPAQNGDIELAFVNEENDRVMGFVGFDNFASRRTGRWQDKFGIQIDSPLGLSDTLQINASHTLKSLYHNFNRSVSFFHSIPYGYWTFSTFGAFSQFNIQLPLQYNTVEQKGHSWQGAAKGDYTFRRDANSISSVYGQLERIKNKSYFEGSLIGLQSPTLTVAQIGINHLQLLPNGSLIADLQYERGLKWWNAMPNQGRDQPEGQFNRWTSDLQFQYYYPVKSQFFRQSHRLSGQYSTNYLPAVKQADLLGRYAVRGFNDLAISAEKSLVLQNNLGWLYQAPQWQIEPYFGFDLGIQKSTAINAKSEKALGYAIGIKAVASADWDWQAQIEWATGRLFQSNGVQQERSINVNTSINF